MIFAHARFGMAVFDDELRFIALNEAMCAMNARAAADQVGLKFADCFPPEESRDVLALMREVLATGEPRLGVEVRYPPAPDPSMRVFSCDYFPTPLPNGRLGVAAVVAEITEERRALMRAAASEARMRDVVDSTMAHVVVLDLEGRVLLANAASLGQAHLTSPDVVGVRYDQTYWWAYEREAAARVAEAISLAASGEIVRRRDRICVGPSRFREVAMQITPVRDECGAPSYLVASLVDITDEVEAQERQVFLATELNHRVKNILAIVRALVTQTARRAPSKEALAHALEGRIGAMARTVAQLNRSDWAGFGLADVHAEQLQHSWAERALISGPNLPLAPKAALAFSLLVYELMSNASKYGALSMPGGRVQVSWAVDAERLNWRWREVGGPPAEEPQDHGFGTVLMRSVAEGDLSGALTLRYAATGFEADFTCPIAAIAARRDSVIATGSTFSGSQILLAETAAIEGLDLLSVLEAAGARVMGPVGTVEAARALAKAGGVRAAVIAARLADPELLSALEETDAPVVLIGGEGPPPPGGARLRKPYADAELVLALQRVMGV